jgi:hypothetical protein
LLMMKAATLFMCGAWCAATASSQPAPSPPAPAPPYSLPWLLRPATAASVVRLDETLAFYEDPASGTGGASYLTGLIVTRKLGSHWVPIFREFFVHNDAPSGASTPSGGGFSNPLLGVNYYRALDAAAGSVPGISYSRALDDPMKAKSYDIVQIDVPFAC